MNKLVILLFLGVSLGVYEARARAQATVDENLQAQARNKEAVRNLINEMFGDKNVDAADKYISAEKYIQHNPTVADGLQAVKASATEWFKGAEKEMIKIARISADEDLVWVHYKVFFLGKDVAIVDIFRFENDKIVEHWDVIQPIPEMSANDHPMF